MSATDAWARAIAETRASADLTLQAIIERIAAVAGERIALFDDERCFSYAELRLQIDSYAGWAQSRRLAGQTIGLLLPNCADYVAIWLGLTRAGCTVALLNTNLPAAALRQCLTTAGADHLVTDAAHVGMLGGDGTVTTWLWPEIEASFRQHGARLQAALPPPNIHHTALYVFTSGTTGLPKATRITHRRIVEWSCWFAGMMNAGADDRMYNCLPMYHSVGGITAVGSMLCKGGSVYIRSRFSAGCFWAEIVEYRCTVFQYIGELCRYLTMAPPPARQPVHKLRLACGNGMQHAVWTTFQQRFGIPHILEFYAATEGALSLYNCDEKPGAIGRIPPFLDRYVHVALVRVDPETNSLLRDASGFCVRCDVDEAGEALSRLIHDRQFAGYTDQTASERKILADVFELGDRWYRSGDLLRRDAQGFFYFVDRLGDTYRWKGENVATTEVAAVAHGCAGVLDAAVYGVTVPGEEGRVGMVALVVETGFTLQQFAAACLAQLPAYARPMFIRIRCSLELTGTFKFNKTQLIRESYGPAGDPVWRMDQKTGSFELLQQAV